MALSKSSIQRVRAKVIGQPGRNMLNMFGDGKSAPKGSPREAVKNPVAYDASGKASKLPNLNKSPKRMSHDSGTITNQQRKNKGGNAAVQLPGNKKQGPAGRKSID